MDMIKLDKIEKRYDKKIIDSFSLELKQGESVCFYGPSGCGKTTLLRILAGLEGADQGSITGLKGKRISFLFQEDRLLPWLNGKENILAVNPNLVICQEWIKKVGMEQEEEKFPTEMSGGMRRRIAIARAMAFESDALFMDEPFQGLDLKRKWDIMKKIKEEKKHSFLFLVTHDWEEAEFLTDRILVMEGPPLKIINQKKSDFSIKG